MASKLTDQYLDAVVSGDLERAQQLKEQLDAEHALKQKAPGVAEADISVPLLDQEIKPVDINKYLNKKFGDEWWNLDMGVIEQKLWQDHAVVMSPQVKDKVWAVKVLCNNNTPFKDWNHFNHIIMGLSGAMADFDMLQLPSAGMMIGGIKSMLVLRPEEKFDDEIKKYAALVIINSGIVVPPPSVSELLKDAFREMISDESLELWPEVYRITSEMVGTKNYKATDKVENIQARRIILAEMAADIYS